jgi:hypothetical protein
MRQYCPVSGYELYAEVTLYYLNLLFSGINKLH